MEDYQNALRLSAAELNQDEKLAFAIYLIGLVTPEFSTQIIPGGERAIFSDHMRESFQVAHQGPPDAKILLPIAIELLMEEI